MQHALALWAVMTRRDCATKPARKQNHKRGHVNIWTPRALFQRPRSSGMPPRACRRDSFDCHVSNPGRSDTFYYRNIISHFHDPSSRQANSATIKLEVQNDKVFSLVGSFLGRFSHRRNKCLSNTQVKGGENIAPCFLSQNFYLLSQILCHFGASF